MKRRKENPTQNNGFPRRLDSKLTEASARIESKSHISETSSGLDGFTAGVNALKKKVSREFTLEGISL